MTEEWLVSIGAIAALLVFSAFFSGSETALTASSRPRMHELARQGDRNASVVLSLYARKERLLGGILLGNNLVNILAASIRSEEHTSELQSLMRISYAVFCLKKKK